MKGGLLLTKTLFKSKFFLVFAIYVLTCTIAGWKLEVVPAYYELLGEGYSLLYQLQYMILFVIVLSVLVAVVLYIENYNREGWKDLKSLKCNFFVWLKALVWGIVSGIVALGFLGLSFTKYENTAIFIGIMLFVYGLYRHVIIEAYKETRGEVHEK